MPEILNIFSSVIENNYLSHFERVISNYRKFIEGFCVRFFRQNLFAYVDVPSFAFLASF